MKLTTTLLLSSTIGLATANTSSYFQWEPLSDEPQFKYDPNTIPPCILWYNNLGRDSCEHIRSQFGISPEDFHKWNPSVGLDCKPWNVKSYCIVSEGRLARFTATASKSTTSSKAAAETASSKAGPITTGFTTTAVTTTTATAITTSKQSSGAIRNRDVFI